MACTGSQTFLKPRAGGSGRTRAITEGGNLPQKSSPFRLWSPGPLLLDDGLEAVPPTRSSTQTPGPCSRGALGDLTNGAPVWKSVCSVFAEGLLSAHVREGWESLIADEPPAPPPRISGIHWHVGDGGAAGASSLPAGATPALSALASSWGWRALPGWGPPGWRPSVSLPLTAPCPGPLHAMPMPLLSLSYACPPTSHTGFRSAI